MTVSDTTLDDLAAEVADLARDADRTVAVAESLTGGKVASALAAAPSAATWFKGSLVAYASDVKHRVLGVPEGPVVSDVAARAMAEGVRDLLDADVAVAVTGAGGPDPQDGRPPGTLFLAIATAGGTNVRHEHVDGEPVEVVAAAAGTALRMVREQLARGRD